MIPNIISLIRLIVVPFLIYLLVKEAYIGALTLIVICGFSDVLDGYLARRYHWETRAGIILDPLADKLLVMSALIYFYSLDFVPLWFVCATFYRDMSLLIGLLALVWSHRRGAVPAGRIRKISAALNLMLVGLLCGVQVYPGLFLMMKGMFWLAAFFVGFSFIYYSYRWFLLYDKSYS